MQYSTRSYSRASKIGLLPLMSSSMKLTVKTFVRCSRPIDLILTGYKLRAVALLNQVVRENDVQQSYESLRLQLAPNALSYHRLCKEYFGGDETAMLETAANFNCKVVAVHELTETADVYDL